MDLFGMARREPGNSDQKYFVFEQKCMIIPDKKGKSGKKVVCGLVYANWCGHCVALKPEWVKMVKSIKEKVSKNKYDEPIFVPFEQSKIELLQDFNTKNSQYLDNKSITYSGFPTLFKIHDGKITYYNGPRQSDAMEKWFMSNSYLKKPVTTNIMRTKTNHGKKHKKSRTSKNRTRNIRYL